MSLKLFISLSFLGLYVLKIMTLKIFTDGGARGNPGPAGLGVVIVDAKNNQVIYDQAKYLGVATNNEAEYEAVILALKHLQTNLPLNTEKLEFFLDSKLVVEQLNKNWKIKEPRMRVLAQKAWQLLESLALPHSITHIKRELNSAADALVNQALDAHSLES